MRHQTVLLVFCLSASLQAGGEAPSPQKDPAPATALHVHVPQQRALASGETHAYGVQLTAGDFIEVVVQPHGINVGVSFAGAEGGDIERSDITVDPDMAETLVAIAATTGTHRVEVPALDTRNVRGSYSIALTVVRPSTSQDGARVDAMRRLNAGARILRAPGPGYRQRAQQEFDQAIALFQQAGDLRGEAWAETHSATNADLGSDPAVRKHAERAVALCRSVGNEQFLSTALAALGLSLAFRGQTDAAVRTLEESVQTAKSYGLRRAELSNRVNLGLVYGRSGSSEIAIDQFRMALEMARALEARDNELGILNNLGIATKDLGNYEASASYYSQALALAEKTPARAMEANLLNNLGNLYRLLGDYTHSKEAHERALRLARDVGNKEHEARALNTLGWTYRELGDVHLALDYFQQALVIRRTLHDPAALASTLDGLGVALHALGDDTALKYTEEGLSLRRMTADPIGEAQSLTHKAQIERDRGQLRPALEDLTAAVQVTDSLRGRIMSPENRASFIAAAQEQYDLYVDVQMQLDSQAPGQGFAARALEASERGRARVLLETLLEGRTEIREGVDPELLASEKDLQKKIDDASRRVSGLIVRGGDTAEVDLARRSLDEASATYSELEGRIRRESPRYAALTQPPTLSSSDIQRDLLDPETLLLEFHLGNRQSWLWCVSAADLKAFPLPPRDTIEKQGREIYDLLTARQPRRGEVPEGRMSRIHRADVRWVTASRAFSRMLLGDAAARLGTAWHGKRLLIVASGVLEYLPFAALPEPLEPHVSLVHGHEIVHAPSASVVSVIRKESAGRPQAAKKLAVLADPVFETDDPRVVAAGGRAQVRRAKNVTSSDGESIAPVFARLPFSREEARTIAALVPARDRLEATGFDASRETATSDILGEYRIVHFATHGVLNTQRPELSGLVLSLVGRDGRAEDGFLRTRDIYNLRLPAELVVLSACQTALGKEIRGEGIIGLTRGFMYAGARRVVATLWQVDDVATSELMRLFYRGMLQQGLTPAAALRAAQRRLAAQPQWSSPFYWSAFVLEGEWRPQDFPGQ